MADMLTTTALVWVLLAAFGVYRRIRRLCRLGRIILPEPVDPDDADYLASVKRSTWLRLGVKLVLLLGGVIALFGLTDFLLFWRLGIVAALLLMDAETVNVDSVRQRLALSAQLREEPPSSRPIVPPVAGITPGAPLT